MRRTPRSHDLRERMQRVAAKHPQVKPTSVRRMATVQQRVEPPPRSEAPPRVAQQSRIETLRAWGWWELTVVPTRRWHWLNDVVRGRTD